ncbi:diamine acetyltransferase 2-like isoform X3 [Trachemys scripta elegans]|uniref:diamine acetyltransferase 2-like isoform X3 n=1 Tax=Trachemys scripta elegans TaxID=31138 RepID=UPI001553106F|nr:diamine acetyltransferase 2-like isoform X3 [Trachemys scripta elegans]
MSYVVRPWALRDLKDVMRLIREGATFHKALDQVKTTPEVLREDGFGMDPKFGCLVAEVPPDQRSKDGKGIGTSLLSQVAKLALAHGCSQFRFVLANWNQPAMALYEKLGAINVTARDNWVVWHIEGRAMQELAERVTQ